MDTAQIALGTPYVFGGTSLRGFDCSGFVQWTYKNIGVRVPRSAQEQSYYGRSVRRTDLRAGDIVAFRHPRRGYHTGIYIGNGKFIHSPRTNSYVQISSLDSAYFRSTYIGARRFPLPAPDDSRLDAALCLIQKHKSARNASRIARSRASAHSQSSSRTRSYVASNSRVRTDAAYAEPSVRREKNGRHKQEAAGSGKSKARQGEKVSSRKESENRRELSSSRSKEKTSQKERVKTAGGTDSKAAKREERADRKEKPNRRDESAKRKKSESGKRAD